MNKPLANPKHEAMVQEYLENGGNKTQAMLKAYPSRKKWKDASVNNKACKFFAQAHVKARISYLREKLSKSEIISKEFIMSDLKAISSVTINDYISEFDPETEKITYKAMEEWTEPMKRACTGFKPTKYGLELSIYGVNFPYTRLCKMLGMDAPDKIDVSMESKTLADIFKKGK